MLTTIDIPIPATSLPYNFDFYLNYYLFYPWVVEQDRLLRLLKLDSGRHGLVSVGYVERPHRSLNVSVRSRAKLGETETQRLVDMLKWVFDVDGEVKAFYEVICQQDPVLKAASEAIYGAHIKADPTVFESVLGVVVAQNVYLRRTYQMLELLCKAFGQSGRYDGQTYYAFPTPERLAAASLADIRACKVGYRDKYIKGIAAGVAEGSAHLEELKESDDVEHIRQTLMDLPGVGPYTADLVMAIGLKKPAFHLDLFSREVLRLLYFDGQEVDDDTLKEFAEKRWGKWQRYAMLLLTTNTDVWTAELGKPFRLKSAARNAG
jgi:3-methyladenine DNA glycosylase/8-oxoguanine DNA glycosylase